MLCAERSSNWKPYLLVLLIASWASLAFAQGEATSRLFDGIDPTLHDAIKAMPFPVVEVHMTNLAAREEWRHRSIISPALKGTVLGLGWRSYTAALRALAEIIAEGQAAKQRGVVASADPTRGDDWT